MGGHERAVRRVGVDLWHEGWKRRGRDGRVDFGLSPPSDLAAQSASALEAVVASRGDSHAGHFSGAVAESLKQAGLRGTFYEPVNACTLMQGSYAVDALHGGADRGGSVRAAIDIGTAALCAEMVGGMQWILETTVDYAKTRQQFGRVIGSFQAVKHSCVDMLVQVEGSRELVRAAAVAMDAGEPHEAFLQVNLAAAYASEAAIDCAQRSLQSCLEQVRNDVCYHQLSVKIVGDIDRGSDAHAISMSLSAHRIQTWLYRTSVRHSSSLKTYALYDKMRDGPVKGRLALLVR